MTGALFAPLPAWPFGDLKPHHYRCIIGDPNWYFKNYSAAGEEKNPVAHYDCMELDQIQALPVADLAATDCAYLMWATFPMLPQAIETLARHGFTYKTGGAWGKLSSTGAKIAFGTGYVLRSAAELFLIGTRGNPRVRSHSVGNLIMSHEQLADVEAPFFTAPIGAHSQKPIYAHEIMELLFDGPRCELFAVDPRPGWDQWGKPHR